MSDLNPTASLRTHRRQASRTQPILTRKSTSDPLEASNVISQSTASTPARIATPIESQSPITKPLPPLQPAQTTTLSDFSFLLRSEIYHPLTNIDSLPPFRTKLSVAPTSISIPDLLRAGQFRHAAIAATKRLTSPPPPLPAEVFSLLYIRLACLLLLGANNIAAAESSALGDLSSSVYLNPETGENILPWSLRLIATRLQSISSSEPRRALVGYYDLATEAREVYSKIPLEDADGRLIWRARLRDLGIRVANCLVEMDDWTGAKRHLQSLRIGLGEGLDGREEDDMLRGRIALVLLRIGDLDGARQYLANTSDAEDAGDGEMHLSGGSYAEALRPLLSLASGNYLSAAAQFRGGLVSDALARQNRAICAVYAGRLNEAKDLLQSLVDDNITPKTVIFNLSTTFELISDKARSMKLGLADELAERLGTAQGWEVTPATFKLTS